MKELQRGWNHCGDKSLLNAAFWYNKYKRMKVYLMPQIGMGSGWEVDLLSQQTSTCFLLEFYWNAESAFDMRAHVDTCSAHVEQKSKKMKKK